MNTGEKPHWKIPLGPNYVEAVRKWGKLEVDTDVKGQKLIAFRYAAEVHQKKYMIKNSFTTRTENRGRNDQLVA